MNTNQLNLFETENDCVPLLLYYLSYLTESCEESNYLFPGKGGESNQPKLVISLDWLLPAQPLASLQLLLLIITLC